MALDASKTLVWVSHAPAKAKGIFFKIQKKTCIPPFDFCLSSEARRHAHQASRGTLPRRVFRSECTNTHRYVWKKYVAESKTIDKKISNSMVLSILMIVVIHQPPGTPQEHLGGFLGDRGGYHPDLPLDRILLTRGMQSSKPPGCTRQFYGKHERVYWSMRLVLCRAWWKLHKKDVSFGKSVWDIRTFKHARGAFLDWSPINQPRTPHWEPGLGNMRKSWRHATVLWMRAASFVGRGTRKSKFDTSFEKTVRDSWTFKHPRGQHFWKRAESPIKKKDWESGFEKGQGVRF